MPVDDLDQCNKLVGKDDNKLVVASTHSNTSRQSSVVQEGSKTRKYFPFKQNYPSVATFRVGSEGIQMTVDGKHITSFAFREVICVLSYFLLHILDPVTFRIFWDACSFGFICCLRSLSFQTLEPWLVSEIRISGDLQLISILASGLPTSEDSEHIIDLEALKTVPLSPRRPLDLFIGVFSTANNFKRRMAVRRTWMQYPAVRSGAVAVRFFVGLVSFTFDLVFAINATFD